MTGLAMLGNPAPPTAAPPSDPARPRRRAPDMRGGVGPGKAAKSAAPGKLGAPRLIGNIVLLAVVVLVANVMAACGASVPTNVRRVVAAADRVQVAGIEAFAEWDDLHQGAIAGRDAPIEERRALLVAYRADRAKVMAGFSALAHASHAAKETCDAFEAGTVKQVDWIRLVGALAEAARVLRDIGKALGFDMAGLEDIIGSAP